VLLRAPGEVQLGTDPRHAVVVEGLSSACAAELLDLGGEHTVAELGDRMRRRGGAAAELVGVLGQLAAAGLVDEPGTGPAGLAPDTTAWRLRTGRAASLVVRTRDDAAVLVHGGGRLATAIASLLAASGVGRVRVAASGPVAPEDTGCGLAGSDVGRPRRDAAAAALRRVSERVRQSPVVPDLVVLADAPVPDPGVVAELMSARVPHLAVRVREGVGVVGPLVVPGLTSCLRCADLHRTDLDPRWPAVAAQLAERPPSADAVAATGTAALAAAQVLLALDCAGSAPPAADTTLELDPVRGVVDHRSWSRHPACDCGAPNGPTMEATATTGGGERPSE
jgi:bacteriocin biosynthesis cyclodehydratase domain-containing protein